jgi:hypothetical protein
MYPTMPDGIGLLIGAVMGTIPALAVLALVIWCFCVFTERRGAGNQTSRTSARRVRVKPKVHETLIDGNATCSDSIWKEMQVRLFAHWQFRCFRD